MMSNAKSVSVADIEDTGINLNQRWSIFFCVLGLLGGRGGKFGTLSQLNVDRCGWYQSMIITTAPLSIITTLSIKNRYQVTDNAIETIDEWRSPSGEKIFQSKLRFQIRWSNS